MLSNIFKVRSGRFAMSYVVSVALIIAITFAVVPASPRSLGEIASETRSSFRLWLHTTGWAKTLSGLFTGQSGIPSDQSQETQTDRDAKVTSISVYPGDVTIKQGERQFFAAVAYDKAGAPVGGVEFIWKSYNAATNEQIPISQAGEFIPSASGSYRLSVEGAGQTAQANVTVLQVENLPGKTAAPSSVQEVSSRDLPSPTAPAPSAPAQPNIIEDPDSGWGPGNYWSGDDPDNERGDPPGRPMDEGAGSGNFSFTAPVLSLPGRGLNLSLNLVYNSRVWNKANSEMTFDIDRDWPAPGWSLGFGRIVGLGASGAMIIDADGTHHSFSGTVTTYPQGYISFTGKTTDGTFIDYNTFTDATGVINYAQIKLPNGTVIDYGAPGRSAVYPQRITDANGNYISIQYRINNNIEKGPKIEIITDTLGRTVNFYYGNGALTAITASTINGPTRTLVRLHYRTLALNYGFSTSMTTRVDDPNQNVLDAIYYPGTGTGYWLGDNDSYSSYGMIAKVIEQRGMGFSTPTFNNMGTVTQGTMTRQSVYNYPLTPNNTLTDAPTYTSMTETWDGMTTAAAITQYNVQKLSTNRIITVTHPDNTKTKQYAYIAAGQYNDGLIYKDETFDASDNLLRSSTTTWAQGDYSSPRPTRIEATDERGQKTAAEFDYGPTNQVTDVRDYNYGGVNRLRTTRMTYRNAVEYTGRHIFNLVKRVDVWDASDTVRLSRVEYAHDVSTPSNAQGVTHHFTTYNPYSPDYNSETAYRGNVTGITRYTNAANLTGAITESRSYDMTGNLVTASTSCCEQTSFVYSLNTQFAYAESKVRGAADPASAARITTSATYDFNTGLALTVTDSNGRVSQTVYFADTLRPQTIYMPTYASATYAYDDAAMTVTSTDYTSAGTVASQNVKRLNGLGQVKREEALGQGSVWDVIETQYDQMRRISKQAQPYNSGAPQWDTTVYDALGRVKSVTAPDNSQTLYFYNEVTRPSSASAAPGQTTRVVDVWGRERWGRADADGRLVEIVEPNSTGSGSVFAAGNFATTYTFDALGNLTQVNQGSQQRRFRFDSLSRLTHQKLAEKNATLNDAGQYVGSGTWSEAFTYDERSNLIAQVDARGVKTNYTYNNDPLSRLQSVSYDTTGFGDTSHPILPAAAVSYEYVTSGDKARLFKVTTAGVSTEELGYDAEGRLASRTLTLTNRPGYPMVTGYIYDSLNRVTDIYYPAQYGKAGTPRKIVHQDYDISSRLTGVKVDGADYASQIVYNAASQVSSLNIGQAGANQATESYTYDNLTGMLTNQKVQRGSTPLLDLSYDYLRTGTPSGRTGQLTKIINNLNRNRDRAYEYDALGRLTKATGGQSALWAQNYSYDRYGNRTSVTATGVTASASEPSQTLPTDNLIAWNGSVTAPNSLRADPTAIISEAREGFIVPALAPASNAYPLSPVPQSSSVNFALPSNGGTMSASSTASGYPTSNANNGDRKGMNWAKGGTGGWMDGSSGVFSDWLQVSFNGTKTITEIDVFTLQDDYTNPVEPTLTQTFSLYGIKDFNVQYWTGTSWTDVPGGSIKTNNKVWRQLTFAGITTDKVRVSVVAALASQSRITEFEAWGTSSATNQPPTVSLTAPSGGQSFTAPATITVSANAGDSDGTVSQVDFFANSTLIGSDSTAPYSITWSNVAAGSYSVTARATDNASATTTSSAASITVNAAGNNPPSVNITQPAPGATFTAPASITINANASDSDGTINKVEFFQGTTLLNTDTVAPYSYAWNSVAAGSYSLTAKATDSAGAITTSAAVSVTVTGSGSTVPRDGLASVSYDAVTNRINQTGWEYDTAGNQTRLQRADTSWQRHVYDAAGRLVKVQDDLGNTQITHTYGSSNHRLIEQVGNESSNQRTYFDWEGDFVLAEYAESSANPATPNWSKQYVYLVGRPLATILPNGASERVEYYHPDRLGTRLITNNQDATTVEQAALPFGTALDAESTGATKQRFTSYERSAVSGLDYAVNRHYDPLQGRFTQVDPIGMSAVSLENPQSLNLYSYCGNDPVNFVDPNGLFLGGLFKAIGKFFGKVFSFFSKAAKWVTVVVAIAVAAAFIFPAIAPVIGDIFFKLGIWKLGAGVPATFLAAEGAAAVGIGFGATSFVLGGLTAAGAVSSFMQRQDTGAQKPQTFRRALDAAIAALSAINPTSRKENREYAGRICKQTDGTFIYTAPNAGVVDTADPGDCPKGTKNSGYYHTHGGNDPEYYNERFSLDDKIIAREEHVPAYLATPARRIKIYDPATRRITTLKRRTP